MTRVPRPIASSGTPSASSDASRRCFGKSWRRFEICGSTSDEAASWARGDPPAPHGAVVTADEQTAGRGRLGHTWYSPRGENLYLSLILRPPVEPRAAPTLTLLAGLAVARTAERWGVRPEVKWPNDLLANGRKSGGILTEMACAEGGIAHVVVGIGVNLNSQAFPAELERQATSLLLETGRPVDREAFAAALLDEMEAEYERWLRQGPVPTIDVWKRYATFLGRRVYVLSGREHLEGIARDVDDEGALLVATSPGRVARIIAGEVTVLA